jgi:hypothetical protein
LERIIRDGEFALIRRVDGGMEMFPKSAEHSVASSSPETMVPTVGT